MARTSWKGAIELSGFPVQIALYNRTKSVRNESFTGLAADGKPVQQFLKDSSGVEITDKTTLRKGIKTGADTYTPLTEAAIEQIAEGGRSTVVAPLAMVPLAELPLELALGSFSVMPDGDVAGSAQAVSIVWNGLKANDLAYVGQITMRGGSPDSIIAIYADDAGLWAVTLPFEPDLNDVPTFDCQPDEAQAAMFTRVLEASYSELPSGWDHQAYESEYKIRRAAAIDAVLAGKPVSATVSAPASTTPDLMAVLAAAVDDAQKAGARLPGAKTRKPSTPRKKVAA
jgi:non-homologous end joining protein Ku